MKTIEVFKMKNYELMCLQEVWIEHVDIERVQHELQEVLNLWLKVKSEPVTSQNTNSSIFTDFINPLAGTEL